MSYLAAIAGWGATAIVVGSGLSGPQGQLERLRASIILVARSSLSRGHWRLAESTRYPARECVYDRKLGSSLRVA